MLVGGTAGQLSQQPGLTDSGIAFDRRKSRVSGMCGRELLEKPRQFVFSTDKA